MLRKYDRSDPVASLYSNPCRPGSQLVGSTNTHGGIVRLNEGQRGPVSRRTVCVRSEAHVVHPHKMFNRPSYERETW